MEEKVTGNESYGNKRREEKGKSGWEKENGETKKGLEKESFRQRFPLNNSTKTKLETEPLKRVESGKFFLASSAVHQPIERSNSGKRDRDRDREKLELKKGEDKKKEKKTFPTTYRTSMPTPLPTATEGIGKEELKSVTPEKSIPIEKNRVSSPKITHTPIGPTTINSKLLVSQTANNQNLSVNKKSKRWEVKEAVTGGPVSPVPIPTTESKSYPFQPSTPFFNKIGTYSSQLPPKIGQLFLLYRLKIAGVNFISPIFNDNRWEKLEQIKRQVERCTDCPLHKTRLRPVFGEGSPYAQLMLIGEGPGEMEDLSGRPFVGRSGQLLTHLLNGIGLKRQQVFIGNIVKCRPPGNRRPTVEEGVKCRSYLFQQIQIIRPAVILTLGKTAFNYLMDYSLPISKVRGKRFQWRDIEVVPTYHPSYLLRNPTAIGSVEQDFKLVKKLLDKKG